MCVRTVLDRTTRENYKVREKHIRRTFAVGGSGKYCTVLCMYGMYIQYSVPANVNACLCFNMQEVRGVGVFEA
jgi:hypothetical protein